MFRVHCNKCSRRRDIEPSIPFQLTQCHHIICSPCLTAYDAEKKCPMCGRPLKSIAISRDMPVSVANYFQDPTKYLQLYRKISKFQSEQRSSDNFHFWRREQRHDELQLKLDGYAKMEAQLNQQTMAAKKRIAELCDYIAFHERPAVDSSLDSSLSSSEYNAGGGHGSNGRPATPSDHATTDNTLSDDFVNSFCLDSEVDFQTRKTNHHSTSMHRSSRRNSVQDFQM